MIIIPDCTQQHTGFRSQIPVQNVFADQGDDQNNDHYLKRKKAFWNDFIYQIILENGTFIVDRQVCPACDSEIYRIKGRHHNDTGQQITHF